MMAIMRISGLEDWQRRLQELGDQSKVICKKAIYEAADILADEVRQEIERLPIDEHWGTEENKLKGIKTIQKIGLEKGFGIAAIREDGDFINVKVGFGGYNRERSKRWPNGKPNVMIARALESGTSFSVKNKFFTRAIDRKRKEAEKKMEEAAEREINVIMRRN